MTDADLPLPNSVGIPELQDADSLGRLPGAHTTRRGQGSPTSLPHYPRVFHDNLTKRRLTEGVCRCLTIVSAQTAAPTIRQIHFRRRSQCKKIRSKSRSLSTTIPAISVYRQYPFRKTLHLYRAKNPDSGRQCLRFVEMSKKLTTLRLNTKKAKHFNLMQSAHFLL